MDYPLFELLFCFHNECDSAIMVVRSLMEKYPKIDARIFFSGKKVSVNPKINNMNQGYAASKYELILISDSKIRMREDTLTDMVNHMDNDVGMVHQMPFTCDRDGYGAILEKIYFGCVLSKVYLASDLLRIIFVFGMSCLTRKSLLEEVGGMRSFGCYLAEDYFLSKSLMDRGWRLSMSSQPALQNSGICDVKSFCTRLERWENLMVRSFPQMILIKPLLDCVLLGVMSSWALHYLFPLLVDPFVVFLLHILFAFLSDYLVLSRIQNSKVPFKKTDFLVGWIFTELLMLFLFVKTLRNWDPVVSWGVGTYKLKWGGLAREVSAISVPVLDNGMPYKH